MALNGPILCCRCPLNVFGIIILFLLVKIVPQFGSVMAAVGMLWLIILGMWIVLALVRADLLRPSRKQMFVVSCIAVSVDPLFLYIPIVDENNKCLGIDNKLRIAALVLRSLTDIPSVLHIIHQIRRVAAMPEVEPWWMDRVELQKLQKERRFKIRRICVHIAIYFLAVLPIPQVMILVIFLRMRDSIVYTRTPIIAFLVLQCLVRAYQIYQSCIKFKRVRRWIKGAFNFLLYILAAHVLGAFWYFSSIERETSCWQQACKNTAGCKHAYYCSNTSASTNIAFLNESCPINPSNTTLFDFGIFLDALQSGNTGSVGFLTKYSYTFWWGIRNLSNFGTNLESSGYIWESCFAILICAIGLLLFMYLLGNVQTYIQMETQKSLLIEEEMIKTKYQYIDTWMSDCGPPEDMKVEITGHLKEHNVVEKHLYVDVDINFLLSRTPSWLIESFRECLCINALNKVPMLHNMSQVALRMMCAYTKPQIYDKNSYVFRKGHSFDTMIIIIKGTLICSNAEEVATSSSMNTEPRILQKGDCYGEKLLEWEKTEECPTLTSKQDVQCLTQVEALVLTLKPDSKIENVNTDRTIEPHSDIENVDVDFDINSSMKNNNLKNIVVDCWRKGQRDQNSINLKNVVDYWRKRRWDQNSSTPQSNLTDSEKEIQRKLNQMDNRSGTTETIKDEKLREKRNIMFKKKAILDWVVSRNFPENLKTEIMTNMEVGNVVKIDMDADVDVKWLLSTDLPEHLRISIKKHLCMNTLKRVPILENMDEDVLMSICKYLKPVVYTENSYLCRTGDRLEFMLIIIEGIFVWTNRHGDAATSSSPLTTRGIVKGDFCGEDILSWASTNKSYSAPTPAPIWGRDIKCQKKVEAFALTAENLRQVVSENKIKWDQGFNNCAGTFTAGTTEHRALEQIIQVQGDMLREQLLNLAQNSMLQFRDDMTEFLAKSGYPGTPPPAP
ncbi:putative cGMP-dependent kinase, Ion transport domain-containing protein [Rosa chinensis]|uniref:Putative cGMP-dependent kinase, Ion transport domain-containing protein n=1 Tax=Rosa chinensis TaxID=74649 RepID=A0A2P6QYT7_ROSCH|nr:cyclic nucleotide-gated ion channel 1 [Rosa chinensis]XP_040374816.1 cyclic nucleotide-gated ion channel 1 [Rosa chinensis]PRQ39341.1 putative cGMP-dependent kinase, Ion transport domain-containing protein [Rosa chinensis]